MKIYLALDYWEKRSTETDNPILQFRYAGLVWDFSHKIRGEKASIKTAQVCMNAAIELANHAKEYCLRLKLERALSLAVSCAVSCNDKNRIELLVKAIIQHEDTVSKIKKHGTWGFSFDILISDNNFYKKLNLKKEQEDKIINDLEEKLLKLSDKESELFDAHRVESVVNRLAPYYRRKSSLEDMKRVLLTYKESFLAFFKEYPYCDLAKLREVLQNFALSKEVRSLEPYIRRQDEKKKCKHFKKASCFISNSATRENK